MKRLITRYILLFIIGSVAFAALFAYLGHRRFHEAGPTTVDLTYVLVKGESLRQISDTLEQRGMIYSNRIFTAGVRLYKFDRRLKAGEYNIPAKASMNDIMEILASGQVIQHKITFVEGWSSFEFIDALEQHQALTGDKPQIPEGSLLPETYFFPRGTTRQQLISQMQEQQQSLLQKLWDNRRTDLPFSTMQEAIILASIVEKETALPSERRHIAGVFINRLRKGMRLQSDPTVVYGIRQGRALERPISYNDLRTAHPYNTYMHHGLPKGPICHPGRLAIEAVFNPMPTEDLYFVADGTGGHRFAKTLQEHNRNVRHWRNIEAEMRKKTISEGSSPESSPPNRSAAD